jgi:DNA repair protein RadA/Sms
MVETATQTTATHSQASTRLEVRKMADLQIDEMKRITTGESELDAVMGGGLVPGMVVLVAGEPGIGKSTLMSQVALKLSKVLYVCGEESSGQVGLRLVRLGGGKLSHQKDMWLLEGTDVDGIVAKIEELKPQIVIVDSIQTLTTADLTGAAGSVGQVRESAWKLTEVAKRLGMPLVLVGHVTKEGNIAGPRVLEHMVDTVLWFEGERSQSLRLIRAVKNRFGPSDEVGVFEMTDKGLVGVSDPSRLLLAERVKNVPGSVISVVVEGKRPLLVEIQALTAVSQLAVPRRVGTGVDMARLQMLIAVLMRRANLHLENMDIFVNVTGGIRLADRGIDVAICLAIASAFLDKVVPEDVAAVGEVGLLGEVRKVTSLDKRVKEAKKLGYRVASAESGKDVAAAIKRLLKN